MQKDAPNHDDEDFKCLSTSAMVLVHNSLSINGDYLGKVPYDIYN